MYCMTEKDIQGGSLGDQAGITEGRNVCPFGSLLRL